MGAGHAPKRSKAAMFAALIAATAWLGLALNVVDVSSRSGSALETIWILIDYFTILTNLLVASAFTILTLRRQGVAPDLLAGLTLSILLVGIVYQLLLRGLYPMTPVGRVADHLLHVVTPVLVPLFWLFAVPKGRLTLRHPFLWAAYPLAYFGYALLRGAATTHYPYPFMNADKIGWTRVFENAAVIASGFIATGSAMVWLDGMLAGRAQPRAG